jgi:ketosteroid isomerase-like protein
MSQENVEAARETLRGLTAQEFDAVVECWHADGEWAAAITGAVEGRTYRGHAGIREYFDDLFTSFSDVRIEELEIRDLGDRVLTLYRVAARGRDSGAGVDRPGAIVYEFRDGKIARARSFLSHAEALEAVGLRE